MSSDYFWKYFFEIFETLPRQGPGQRECTERALSLLPPLSQEHRILDIGCGTGAQTLDLARATEAQIVAVDNHPPFVNILTEQAAELKLDSRVTAQVGDMGALPFEDGSFQVVWSEGAVFIIGFAEGLTKWRPLLAPGGHMVISEFCWFQKDPAEELKEIFLDGNPEVGNREARRKTIAENGYRLLHEFVLPDAGWWENFYVPQSRSLELFREKHASNPEALEVADKCQQQIDLHKRYPDAFGYVFFVMRPE